MSDELQRFLATKSKSSQSSGMEPFAFSLGWLAEQVARHGYAVVPVEPTEAMIGSGDEAADDYAGTVEYPDDREMIALAYRAMIEAGRVKP